MRVYIAGPIAGYADANRRAFTAAAERLAAAGHDVVNPHDVTPHDHGELSCPERGYFPGENDRAHTSSCCFMRTDLAAMLTCDAIYLLVGWEHSRGARDEFAAAMSAGLDPVHEVADPNVWAPNAVMLRDLQGDVAEWVRHNFGNDNELATVGGLVEECGEVMRAAVKRSQGIRGTREEWDAELRKESADVLIKLCDVAAFYGFDLSEAVATRWGQVRQRDWRANPQGHGIGGAS